MLSIVKSGGGLGAVLLAAVLITSCSGGDEPATSPADEDTEQLGPAPVVVPQGDEVDGMSYAEWGVAWWNWAGSFPGDTSPVTDSTGERCDEGQSGKVWFLAGTTGGRQTRTCAIRADSYTFFPLLNVICPVAEDGVASATAQCEESLTNAEVSASVNSTAILDPPFVISGPFDFRPDPASWVGSVQGEAVSAGYYLMLEPLPAGKHTIAFKGTIPDEAVSTTFDTSAPPTQASGPPAGFVIDVLYEITVE